MDGHVVSLRKKEEEALQRTLPEVKTIDIEFQNVSYTVQQNSGQSENKKHNLLSSNYCSLFVPLFADVECISLPNHR